jgi:hypothetical protein
MLTLCEQFIVMFRSRFSNAFPKSLMHYGPQDIERGISEPVPGEHVERLLCALLGLVLNRKKDVERGHYGRALEEAIQTHSSQWPAAWKGANPLHAAGPGSFNNMDAEQRLVLMKALILWALSGSEAVSAIIKESYKQTRRDDDLNQPLSVQPWGRDGYKRNYWLIEGQDDTHFRVYRENNGTTAKTNTWFSVAGDIDEVLAVATKLDDENTPHSRALRDKIKNAIPRFEAGEEKRRRRDYRLARKEAFRRPEPGFSMYEGRTRGKRMKYSYSDEEGEGSDFSGMRRSTRNSGISTPVDNGPTVTQSGRQVRSRIGGMYGETMLVDQRKEIESERAAAAIDSAQGSGDEVQGRSRRSRQPENRRPAQRRYEELGSEEESEAAASEGAWSGNEDEPDDSEPEFEEGADEDEEMSENEDSNGEDVDEDENTQESLVVQLRYKKEGTKQAHVIQQKGGNDLSTNGIGVVSSAENDFDNKPPAATLTKDEVMMNGHNGSGAEMHNGPGSNMMFSNAPQPVQL